MGFIYNDDVQYEFKIYETKILFSFLGLESRGESTQQYSIREYYHILIKELFFLSFTILVDCRQKKIKLSTLKKLTSLLLKKIRVIVLIPARLDFFFKTFQLCLNHSSSAGVNCCSKLLEQLLPYAMGKSMILSQQTILNIKLISIHEIKILIIMMKLKVYYIEC